jgi:hypothetical protein
MPTCALMSGARTCDEGADNHDIFVEQRYRDRDEYGYDGYRGVWRLR